MRGTWKVARAGRVATLRAELFAPLSKPERAAVEDEAAGLLAFVAGDADTRDVHLQ